MNFFDITTKVTPRFQVSNFLSVEPEEKRVQEIYTGLAAEQKYVSSRFFYDDRGSELFEQITTLPEYYPTRTEQAILSARAGDIMSALDHPELVELGSGDCSKISILLDAIPQEQLKEVSYVPVDVSQAALYQSAEILLKKYDGIRIHGLLGDFLRHLHHVPRKGKRLISFFGSTIGNLTRSQAGDFMKDIGELMEQGDQLLLGTDRVKDEQLLLQAYNDSQGITARFNKNILHVVNQVAGTDLKSEDFKHVALYRKDKARIEMHLQALQPVEVTSPLFPDNIHIRKGESIHTENSHKFTGEDIEAFAAVSGLTIKDVYTDEREWFALTRFEANGASV